MAVLVVPDEQVGLSAWNHLVPVGEWIEQLKQDPLLAWSDEPVNGARPLARLQEADGCVHDLYANNADEEAVPESGEVLLSYPEYTLSELKRVVESGRLMPAGVTRSMVRGRLLNLRIPLDLLLTETFQGAKWEYRCSRPGRKACGSIRKRSICLKRKLEG